MKWSTHEFARLRCVSVACLPLVGWTHTHTTHTAHTQHQDHTSPSTQVDKCQNNVEVEVFFQNVSFSQKSVMTRESGQRRNFNCNLRIC